MKRWALILTSVVFSMGCNILDDNPKVGSRDCAVLGGGPEGLCQVCQAQPCDSDEVGRSESNPQGGARVDTDGDGVNDACYFLPCIDGAVVVEGCEEDTHCAHMSTPETRISCGMGNSYHGGFCGTDAGNF